MPFWIFIVSDSLSLALIKLLSPLLNYVLSIQELPFFDKLGKDLEWLFYEPFYRYLKIDWGIDFRSVVRDSFELVRINLGRTDFFYAYNFEDN